MSDDKQNIASYPSVVLLYSGGLESRFLLALALRLGLRVLCVLVNYGQQHSAEIMKAQSVCTQLRVSHTVVTIDLPMLRSRLTGESDASYPGVSEYYIPARNLMLLSVAASVAESRGIDTIWFGASYTDRLNRFPDCTQEWVVDMNTVFARGFSRQLQIVAPLLGWTKEMVRLAARVAGIQDEEVYSGYGESSSSPHETRR